MLSIITCGAEAGIANAQPAASTLPSTSTSMHLYSYSDPVYGIKKISYPAGWLAGTAGLQEGTIVLFTPPQNASTTDRLAWVALLVHPTYGNSLKDIASWEASRHNTDQAAAAAAQEQNATLSGLAAKQLSVTWNSNGHTAQVLYFIAVQGGKEYALQFIAVPGTFQKYLPQVQAMAKSLQIDTSKIPSVSGQFSDPVRGLSFTLPPSWTGLQYVDRNNLNNTHIVAFSHVGLVPGSTNRTDYASMSIITDDNRNLPQIHHAQNLCSPPQSSEIVFLANKVKALHYIAGCNFAGDRTLADTYQLVTAQRTVFVVFTASSNSSFTTYTPEFEKIAGNFSASGAADLSDFTTLPAAYANHTSEQVTVGSKPSTVQIETTSAISDFQYNEPAKQISFKAVETGKRGFTVIDAGKIIGQPHSATMDGSPTGYTAILDRTSSNSTYIQLDYGSGLHTFTVTGTAVK
jgi:hypothetical protein